MPTYTVGVGCTYANFTAALAGAYAPGDIIEARADSPGGSKTFTENISWNKANVTIRGRVGDLITITSASGNYTWVHVFGTNGVTYQNLNITGGALAAFNFRTGTDVSFIDVVLHCTLGHGMYVDAAITTFSMLRLESSDNLYDGIFFNAACTGTVTDCKFRRNGWYGVAGQLGGITWTGTVDQDTLVSSLDFSDNGLHGFSGDSASDNCVVSGASANNNGEGAIVNGHRNNVGQTRHHGFVFAHGYNNFTLTKSVSWGCDLACDIQTNGGALSTTGGAITNNILIGEQTGAYCAGLYFSGDVGKTMRNINVFANVLAGNGDSGGKAIFIDQYADSGIVIKDNIIVDLAGGKTVSMGVGSTYPTMDYNLYYSSAALPFDDKGTAVSFAEWKTNSSQDSHGTWGNPRFVQSAYPYNVRLKTISPAIGAGINAGLSTDYAGNSVGTPVDIGPYQFTGEVADVDSNLCAAIMTYFNSSAGSDLSFMINGNLFEGEAPMGTPFPYAVFSVISAPKEKTFTEEYTNALIQFDFFSSANAAEARYLRFLAYQLFDEKSFPITGSTLVWLKMENEMGGSDPESITTPTGTAKVWQATADYEVKTVLN
jgi:hypothetical protein